MASGSQLNNVPPNPPSGYGIAEEINIISIRTPSAYEKSVKVGCCSHLRRRKNNSNFSRRCCFSNQHNAKHRGFCAYLRFIWIDALTLLLLGIVILVLHFLKTSRDRPLMPFWTQDAVAGNITVENLDFRAPYEYLYPYQKLPLSDISCATLIILVPIIVIGLFQIKICSVWDFHAGLIGIVKALIITSCIALAMKLYVASFRPNFFDACQPNRTLLYQEAIHHLMNHTAMFFNATICTGEDKVVSNALQSFPSGHVANSFAAAIFLTLYMNAKLKAIGDHASQCWVFFLTIMPLVLASLLGALMYITHQHHTRDLYTGMILGLMVGTVTYRSVYASILDSRYNHIPLPPFAAKTRFLYLKGGKRTLEDISEEPEEEIDSLVVWDWWKLGSNEESRRKADFWLKNVRTTRTMDCESIFGSGQTGLPQSSNESATQRNLCEERTEVASVEGDIQEPQISHSVERRRCARHAILSEPSPQYSPRPSMIPRELAEVVECCDV